MSSGPGPTMDPDRTDQPSTIVASGTGSAEGTASASAFVARLRLGFSAASELATRALAGAPFETLRLGFSSAGFGRASTALARERRTGAGFADGE